MRVCNCARAGTEACNHCPSGTMVEPYDPPFDWRDEIIAALRAENARLREVMGEIATMTHGETYAFRLARAALSSQAPEAKGEDHETLWDGNRYGNGTFTIIPEARGEAHSKSEQRRGAIQQEAKGESGEVGDLRDALQLMVDAVMKSGDATQALSIARALLAHKPSEEQKP